MLDPRALYTISPGLLPAVQGKDSVLIHLLEGYVDAGAVSRTLAEHILAQCEHEVLVEFDSDQLHDYRSRRPISTFDTNHWVEITMPTMVIHRCVDAAGADFLLLTGPEPDTQWARACAALLDVATVIGVTQLITASGVPMGVPHTRPVLVTGHSTVPDLVQGNPLFIDRVDIPGSFASLLEVRAGEGQLLGRGFVAHVPHYLAQGAFLPATQAVLSSIVSVTGLDIPAGPLPETVHATLEALDAEVAGDDELPGLVAALEKQYDDLSAQGNPVPSADEIGAAVEQFLAEQDETNEG